VTFLTEPPQGAGEAAQRPLDAQCQCVLAGFDPHQLALGARPVSFRLEHAQVPALELDHTLRHAPHALDE